MNNPSPPAPEPTPEPTLSAAPKTSTKASPTALPTALPATPPATSPASAPVQPHITWTDPQGQAHQADWRSLAGHAPPKRIEVVDDTIDADTAYRLACEGTGLLWAGDFQNARLLLQALGRRMDKREDRRLEKSGQRPKRASGSAKAAKASGPLSARAEAAMVLMPRAPVQAESAAPSASALQATALQAFHAHRKSQAERARILGRLLLPFEADHAVPLRRAPDLRQAGLQAHGAVGQHYVASLRELLGLVGAYEWRKKGVPVEALDAKIHPWHGVFSPVRGEYIQLVHQAPLPAAAKAGVAFDIGTGTGVLAAVLARRQLNVVATDNQPQALACARDNLKRLKLDKRVQVQEADMFPPGRAALVVCNPPWVPAQPSSPLEAAVYDPDSRMLKAYLAGLSQHLAPGGEGWLLLSDLAEHLGLRSRAELLGWIRAGGLKVLGRLDAKAEHAKAADAGDTLHQARAAETTTLWRLGPA